MKLRYFFVLPIVLFLISCGLDNRSSEEASVSLAETSVAGRIVKGVVSHGVVSVYAVENGDLADEAIVTTRSSEYGDFSFALPAGYSRPFAIVVTADAETRMICDASDGCVDPANGADVGMGQPVAVAEGFRLRAMSPLLTPGTGIEVNVTVFSDMAAELAESRAQPQGLLLDANSIIQANAEMTDLLRDHGLLKVGDQLLSVRPADVTRQSDLDEAFSGAHESNVKLGFASAAIARIARDNYDNSIAAVMAAARAVYLQHDGELPLIADLAASQRFGMNLLLQATLDEITAYSLTHQHGGIGAVETAVELALNNLPIVDGNGPPPPGGGLTDSDPPGDAPKDDLEAAKELVQAFRALLHTADDTTTAITGALVDATGNLLTSNLTQEGPNLVGVAKEFYPYMGSIILAMMTMVEDENSPPSYDLAADPNHLLPDGIQMRGVVRKTIPSYQPILSLENGWIEGLGRIDFYMKFSGCWYCWSGGDGSVYVQITIDADAGRISFSDTIGLERRWVWWQQRYLPERMRFSGADVRVAVKDETGNEVLTLGGRANVDLRWRSGYVYRLPIVESLTLYGGYTDNNHDISSFNARFSYTNFNWYAWQQANLVDWAHEHSDYFDLTVDFDARIRVPMPGTPNQVTERDVGIAAGIARKRYPNERREWVEIAYEGQAFRFERIRESGRYAFYDQSGALMELLIADGGSGQSITGSISVDGDSVASIVDTFSGPIIRYIDGAIESF